MCNALIILFARDMSLCYNAIEAGNQQSGQTARPAISEAQTA